MSTPLRIAGVLAALGFVLGGCNAEPGVVEAALATATATVKASIKKGTLFVTGTKQGEHIALRLSTSTTLDVDVGDDGTADFSFDRSKFDHIRVDAGDGDDVVRIDDSLGVFTDQDITTLAGGSGNDTLLGGSGAETLLGGPGDDFIVGNRGTDIVSMGDGNDTFVWNPGDGSDVVDGDGGSDVLLFNGANVGEAFDLAANGTRLDLTRDIGGISMDVGGVERVDIPARGGADRVTVNDLAGTGVARVNVDLAATAGTDTGDSLADVVIVEGTANADTINVAADGAAVVATGLATTVSVTGGEPSLDSLQVDGAGGDPVNVNGSPAADNIAISESSGHALVSASGFNVFVDAFAMSKIAVNGLGGDDVIRLNNGQNQLPIQLDGGDGNDQLSGGNFPDLLLGGAGDDVITGGQGADTILMGDGNDTFVWNPGDGSDVVDGQAGTDVLTFNAANIGETIDLGANGTHLRVQRDIGAVTLDVAGIERADILARGGVDRVTVHDLTGTPVSLVNVDLASFPGSGTGDTVSDTVIVEGSPNADTIFISADGAAVVVSGLAATTRITGADPIDQLIASGLGGVDTFLLGSGVTNLMTVITSQD